MRTRLNICHGNSDRIASGLRSFVCIKGGLRWKIIPHPQGPLNNLELDNANWTTSAKI